MGIGKLIEEVAGAVAAEQAAEAIDPNAGILVKGAAAIAGFEGVNKLTDVLESHAAKPAAPAAPPAADPSANADDAGPEPQ
ncbi:MAG: hypothetical protein ACLPN5_12795 [Roseiarcus sp.]